MKKTISMTFIGIACLASILIFSNLSANEKSIPPKQELTLQQDTFDVLFLARVPDLNGNIQLQERSGKAISAFYGFQKDSVTIVPIKDFGTAVDYYMQDNGKFTKVTNDQYWLVKKIEKQ